ncbi:MAG TPA: hypothetical protein VK530_04355 [Candidatus Acidoferrum sp.]|nr:hypothetical protein [Candidatus Acidoferrum sp.]
MKDENQQQPEMKADMPPPRKTPESGGSVASGDEDSPKRKSETVRIALPPNITAISTS